MIIKFLVDTKLNIIKIKSPGYLYHMNEIGYSICNRNFLTNSPFIEILKRLST